MMIARTALIAGLLSLAAGSMALAAGSSAPGPSTDPYRVNGYQVETDESHFNFNTGDFTMPRHVRFYRPGTDVVGDRAQGNSKRGIATVSGSVVVHDSGSAPEAGVASYNGSGPATLTCDQLEIDAKGKVYVATGHVHFSQAGRSGSADRGTLDRSSGILHLDGNVHLTDGGSSLAANTVDYNLNTKDADVHGSPAVITQPQGQGPQPQRQAAPPPRKPAPSPKPVPAHRNR